MKRLACELVRECIPFKLPGNATDGSRRITMLLFDRFSVRGSPTPFTLMLSFPSFPSSSSLVVSAIPIPLNQPIPYSYGFASGEPFMLSMFSSVLGRRSVGGGTPSWLPG